MRNGSTLIGVNSINTFKQELLPLIHLSENIIFNIFDSEGFKLFTRLRLGFRYLNENRVRQSFQKCLKALYTCGLEIENSCNYLLHCNHNILFRIDLTNSVKTFVVDFESLPGSKTVAILLYGDSRWDDNKNNGFNFMEYIFSVKTYALIVVQGGYLQVISFIQVNLP